MKNKAALYLLSDKKKLELPNKIELDASKPIIIGREHPARVFLDLPVQPQMLSRTHVKIWLDQEEGWKFEDLNSMNGILLNDLKKLKGVLSDGDVITFGGARKTKIDERPSPQAKKSLYTYKFIIGEQSANVNTVLNREQSIDYTSDGGFDCGFEQLRAITGAKLIVSKDRTSDVESMTKRRKECTEIPLQLNRVHLINGRCGCLRTNNRKECICNIIPIPSHPENIMQIQVEEEDRCFYVMILDRENENDPTFREGATDPWEPIELFKNHLVCDGGGIKMSSVIYELQFIYARQPS